MPARGFRGYRHSLQATLVSSPPRSAWCWIVALNGCPRRSGAPFVANSLSCYHLAPLAPLHRFTGLGSTRNLRMPLFVWLVLRSVLALDLPTIASCLCDTLFGGYAVNRRHAASRILAVVHSAYLLHAPSSLPRGLVPRRLGLGWRRHSPRASRVPARGSQPRAPLGLRVASFSPSLHTRHTARLSRRGSGEDAAEREAVSGLYGHPHTQLRDFFRRFLASMTAGQPLAHRPSLSPHCGQATLDVTIFRLRLTSTRHYRQSAHVLDFALPPTPRYERSYREFDLYLFILVVCRSLC